MRAIPKNKARLLWCEASYNSYCIPGFPAIPQKDEVGCCSFLFTFWYPQRLNYRNEQVQNPPPLDAAPHALYATWHI